MKPRNVLVLGNHAHRELEEALSRCGFTPQVWGSMRHSLEKLRRHQFNVVLVDRNFTQADVLEFILNVRDIDQQVPVIVLGSGPDKIDRKIAKQSRTAILNAVEDGNDLAKKLIGMDQQNETRAPPPRLQD
ncbi:MAG: hypothetical protein JXN61_02990 [Sedimentisphaerales bacterium]|nr:hypothetical protein [Sedimentisphaerales bacterium]